MRDSRRCPKCRHSEILHVPRLIDSEWGWLLVHMKSEGLFPPTPRKFFGTIEAYICATCGYTELFTLNQREIPISDIEGAEVLRGEPEKPYR
jgi:predicted nucleic-acid-binding Zn-ribbon protein